MSASMELRRDPLPTASHLSGDEVARLRVRRGRSHTFVVLKLS